MDYKKIVNITMLTYNRIECTKKTIEDSLVKTTGYPYLLTVVDNNSRDGTQEYLKDLQNQGIIHNLVLLPKNLGVAKAANIGWMLENRDYYIKYDNDILFTDTNWLKPMIDLIDNVPEVSILGYQFEKADNPLKSVNGYTFKYKPQGGSIGGACVLIPRRTHEKYGFWREDYSTYGEEDADFSYRVFFGNDTLAYMNSSIGIHMPENYGYNVVLEDTNEEKNFRQWKDECRNDNLNKYYANLNIYKTNERSRYISSSINLEDLKDYIHRIPYE